MRKCYGVKELSCILIAMQLNESIDVSASTGIYTKRKKKSQFYCMMIFTIIFLTILFIFGCALGMQKFLGQGLNTSHSTDTVP